MSGTLIKPGAAITAVATTARTFDLIVNVTAYLEGELKDWPANIQDGVYIAMQRVANIRKLKNIHVLQSFCGRDDINEPYYIRVTIVGEVTLQ